MKTKKERKEVVKGLFTYYLAIRDILSSTNFEGQDIFAEDFNELVKSCKDEKECELAKQLVKAYNKYVLALTEVRRAIDTELLGSLVKLLMYYDERGGKK